MTTTEPLFDTYTRDHIIKMARKCIDAVKNTQRWSISIPARETDTDVVFYWVAAELGDQRLSDMVTENMQLWWHDRQVNHWFTVEMETALEKLRH